MIERSFWLTANQLPPSLHIDVTREEVIRDVGNPISYGLVVDCSVGGGDQRRVLGPRKIVGLRMQQL